MNTQFEYKGRTFQVTRRNFYTYVGLGGYIVARSKTSARAIREAKEAYDVLGLDCTTSHKLIDK